MQSFNRVPEAGSKESMKLTSLVFYLSKDEYEMLERISKIKGVNTKNTSSFIRLIIKNTYLYLNNMERNIISDIEIMKDKSYYRGLKPEFVECFKPWTREYDFLMELVRIQVLRSFQNGIEPDEKNRLERFSFRLTQDDEYDLKRIIVGNKIFSNPELFQSYIRYFLSVGRKTQYYILSYPNMLMLERAIKESRWIIINNKKYKPYKIIDSINAISIPYLICFDEEKNFNVKNLMNYLISEDVEETNLEFTFNSKEKKIIKSFTSLKTIEASFKINDPEDKLLAVCTPENYTKTYLLKSCTFSKGKTTITFDYTFNSVIIKNLENALKNGKISYLCYNQEYYDFLELIKE